MKRVLQSDLPKFHPYFLSNFNQDQALLFFYRGLPLNLKITNLSSVLPQEVCICKRAVKTFYSDFQSYF